MKKTMALCALLVGLGASAQHRPHHTDRGNENRTELSPQQRATLQSKRMTLALGLDQQQQDQIAALLKTRLDERMEWKARQKSEAGSDGTERWSVPICSSKRPVGS